VGCFAGVLFLSAGAYAAPALRLAKVFPPAGPVGGKIVVACTGAGLEQATAIHFSLAGVSAKVVHATPASATFEVTIEPDAPPGICEARVVTPSGISNPRAFCISACTKEEVASGNHTPDQAVTLGENVGVSTNCTADSSACYTIELLRNHPVRFESLAQEIDSRMLPVMLLSDDRGRELARSRRGGRLDFVAPRDGRYTLEVHDLLYRGGDEYFYHLACTGAPEGPVEQPSLAASDGICKIFPPCEIRSCFAKAGVFEFAARQGDSYWVEIISDRLGQGTAPQLTLESVTSDRKGQRVQNLREVNGIDGSAEVRVADGMSLTRDVAIPFEVEQTGTYRVTVRNLLPSDRDGAAPAYRLCIRRPQPDFELLASEPPAFDDAERKLRSASKGVFLRNGGCTPILLTVHRRDGFAGEIRVEAEGLPKGMSVSGIIPAGQDQGVLMIQSEPGMPGWSGTIRLVGRAQVGQAELTHEAQYETVVWPATTEQAADVRLARDLGIAVEAEPEPLTIEAAPGAPLKARSNAKLHLPLLLTSHAQIKPSVALRVGGLAELGALPVLTVDPTQKHPAVDLDIARKLAPGIYTIYFEATVTVHLGKNDLPETVYSRPIRFEVTAG